MMNPVIHFELPFKNAERATAFYQNIFGWEAKPLDPEVGPYIFLTTSDRPIPSGSPEGTINGGLYPTSPSAPHPMIVIGVENIKAALEKIITHGGKKVSEITELPNIGLYIRFLDTEGNQLAMIQPKM